MNTSLTCPVYWVNAFGAAPDGGSGCVVVLNADGASERAMQSLAAQFNVGETSFVSAPTNPGCSDGSVRIFTPLEERTFAGVPLMGIAYALLNHKGRDRAEIKLQLELKAGLVKLRANTTTDGFNASFDSFKPEFDWPASSAQTATVIKALGLEASDLLPGAPIQVVSTGTRQLMVCLRDLASVLRVTLAREGLQALRDNLNFASLRVFCAQGYDRSGDCFGRHFYALATSVGQDPFTGSSAGSMAAYLWHHALSRRSALRAQQGHNMGRPCSAQIELIGTTNDIQAVRLSGSVYPVLIGQLNREVL